MSLGSCPTPSPTAVPIGTWLRKPALLSPVPFLPSLSACSTECQSSFPVLPRSPYYSKGLIQHDTGQGGQPPAEASKLTVSGPRGQERAEPCVFYSNAFLTASQLHPGHPSSFTDLHKLRVIRDCFQRWVYLSNVSFLGLKSLCPYPLTMLKGLLCLISEGWRQCLYPGNNPASLLTCFWYICPQLLIEPDRKKRNGTRKVSRTFSKEILCCLCVLRAEELL